VFARSDPRQSAPDLEVVFVPGPFAGEGFDLALGHAMSIDSVLPSRGQVELRSLDPMDALATDPCYLSDPCDDDHRALAAGLMLCERILAAPALAPYVGELLRPATPTGAG
jgi:choline dehydrogenase